MKMLAFKDMPYTRPDMDAMKKALAEATEKLRTAAVPCCRHTPSS